MMPKILCGECENIFKGQYFRMVSILDLKYLDGEDLFIFIASYHDI